MSANQEPFELNFYKWEKEFKDKPYLRQPIGEEWEEYTWGQVGEEDHLKNLIDTTIKKYDKIDILVNIAGINPVFDRLENADEKLF